jgi:hypothetical protein
MANVRSDAVLKALIKRMRAAAARGLSMTEFGATEGLSRGAVAGLKHRARPPIIFHAADDPERRSAWARENNRRRYANRQRLGT